MTTGDWLCPCGCGGWNGCYRGTLDWQRQYYGAVPYALPYEAYRDPGPLPPEPPKKHKMSRWFIKPRRNK